MIGEKQGTKWTRKSSFEEKPSTTYDYYTRGYQNTGSFGVHILVSGEDKNLEQQLDKVVQTIKFIQ
jgi:hypothetical protein